MTDEGNNWDTHQVESPHAELARPRIIIIERKRHLCATKMEYSGRAWWEVEPKLTLSFRIDLPGVAADLLPDDLEHRVEVGIGRGQLVLLVLALGHLAEVLLRGGVGVGVVEADLGVGQLAVLEVDLVAAPAR